MKLDKELTPGTEDIPGVPDILKQHLLRKLRGPAVRVKVEARTSAASHTLLNAIRLAERGAANNAPDIDAVAELVTRIIHAYHIEHESDEGYTSQYRVTCELRSDNNRQPKSERSFMVRYQPGAADEDNDLLRENDVLTQALDTLRENNNSLAVQVSDLHNVVLDFARSMNEPIRASSEMSYNATQQWINGANLLVQAHQTMFNVDAIRAQEAAKTERVNAILANFGGTLNNLSAGVIDYALKKMGVRAPGPAKPATKTPEPAAVGTTDAPPAAEPEPEIDQSKALAFLVESFSTTINPKQRKELNTVLTKKQLSALDDLFCAEDNDQVVDCWEAAATALGMEKLVWMNSLLTLDQQNDFNTIRTYIGRYAEKRKAEKK